MQYLNDVGLLCTLGSSAAEVSRNLVTVGRPLPRPEHLFSQDETCLVGRIQTPLPILPSALSAYDCRNNRLALAAVQQIETTVATLIERCGRSRVAVVMGTSTGGIDASERAVAALASRAEYPKGYHAIVGVLGGLAEFVQQYLGVSGPAYTVSTACSSSANAVLSAQRLLRLGVCDAVVVGGVDSLCQLTLGGFGALEAMSPQYNRPFADDRKGINIGEAAAVFVMSNEPAQLFFAGGGSSSDAHHISAPQPQGDGAYRAMAAALAAANLSPDAIDYLNLHGTATAQNDAMESAAAHRLLGAHRRCSSTKSFTGHTLGAAGALELAFCCLLLNNSANWRYPPSLYGDSVDTSLPALRFTGSDDCEGAAPRYCMSNSFAFGGSNVSLIVGKQLV